MKIKRSAPNFRVSKACFDCSKNSNRLDKDETENIVCKRYEIDKSFIALDWVCDDHSSIFDGIALEITKLK